MKLTQFKNILKESFREVLREELKVLLREELQNLGTLINSDKDVKEVKSKINLEHIFANTPLSSVNSKPQFNFTPKTKPKNILESVIMETANNMSGDDFKDIGNFTTNSPGPMMGMGMGMETAIPFNAGMVDPDVNGLSMSEDTFNMPNLPDMATLLNRK